MKNFYPNRLRRISFRDETQNRTLVFLTNNFALSAATIAALYKARWEIELFFKWIKQNLRVKTFYGTSQNAVKTQILIAMIVCDSLNLQLLQLLSEEEEVPISLVEKKRQYERLWKKVELRLSPQNRVLVLIDGLDESALAGQQPLVEYLPPKPSNYVYWVLTSRPLPDVLSAIPTTHLLRKAHSYSLSGLKADEVRKLLHQNGDQVERSNDFINRLINKTNGEPLFLRFLCQDIPVWREQAEARLEEIPGEVKVYFQRQFKLLRERTKEAYDRNLPLDILKILVVAYSGMTTEELAGILGVALLDIRESLELIERFLR